MKAAKLDLSVQLLIKFLAEFGYLPEAQPRSIHKGRVRGTALQPNFSVVR